MNGIVWTRSDVRYVPSFSHNLLSVSKLSNDTNNNITIHFDDSRANILMKYTPIIIAQLNKRNGLYQIPLLIPSSSSSESHTTSSSCLYHRSSSKRDIFYVNTSHILPLHSNKSLTDSSSDSAMSVILSNTYSSINTTTNNITSSSDVGSSCNPIDSTSNNNHISSSSTVGYYNHPSDSTSINQSTIVTPSSALATDVVESSSNNHSLTSSSSSSLSDMSSTSSSNTSLPTLIHHRMGHLGWKNIYHLASSEAITGLPMSHSLLKSYATKISGSHMLTSTCPCDPCARAKGHRQPFHSISRAPPAPFSLYRIFVDLSGPIHVQGQEYIVEVIGIQRYVSVIIDDYSRMLFVRIMSCKSGATSHIIDWLPQAENVTGKKLIYFHSDGGGEYMSTTLKQYLEEKGVKLLITSKHTPQHNGKAERSNRTIFEMARALLFHAHLDSVFWGYAIQCAVHILNRRIVYSNHTTKTPLELWSGIKPDVSHLRVFGCDAYVHLSQGDPKPSKLESRTIPCIFVGYSEHTINSYIFFDPTCMRTLVRRDADFFEERFTIGREGSIGNGGDILESLDQVVLDDVKQSQQLLDSILLPTSPSSTSTSTSSISSNNSAPLSSSTSANNNQHTSRYPSRTHRPPSGPAGYGRFTLTDYYAPDLAHAFGVDPKNAYSYVMMIVEDSALDDIGVQLHCALLIDSIGISTTITSSSDSYACTATTSFSSSSRTIISPQHTTQHNNIIIEPTNMAHAKTLPQWPMWKAAADKEMDAINEQKTWVLVKKSEVPSGSPIISSRWLFKLKYDSHGHISTYKARLVARGFQQREGIDYNETFSPTIKYRSQRLIQALAATLGYCVRQIDIGNAFLYGTLKETIYMSQPEGYIISPNDPTSNNEIMICKLIKSLYGTKQAPREWNTTLDDFIINTLGMKSCIHDPCVYVKSTSSHRIILLSVFVDDCTFSYSILDEAEMLALKHMMEQRFKVKDLGESEWLLGMHISRDTEKKTMSIDVERYIEKILERFNMQDCYPHNSPALAGQKLSKDACPNNEYEKKAMEQQRTFLKGFDFRQVIGSLLYASLASRPDITYAVSQISMFSSNPGLSHWKAAERILRYLKATKYRTLTHQCSIGDIPIIEYQPRIVAYSDSDHAGDLDTRRSTTGFIIYVNGNPVSWTSKRQTSVALSSAEAEYMALAETAKEILWLRYLLCEIIGHPLLYPAILYCDNQSAIAITKNDQHHNRTKHIDYRYHFIRECVKNNYIQMEWVGTAYQHADIFTKALPDRPFAVVSEMIMKSSIIPS